MARSGTFQRKDNVDSKGFTDRYGNETDLLFFYSEGKNGNIWPRAYATINGQTFKIEIGDKETTNKKGRRGFWGKITKVVSKRR